MNENYVLHFFYYFCFFYFDRLELSTFISSTADAIEWIITQCCCVPRKKNKKKTSKTDAWKAEQRDAHGHGEEGRMNKLNE